MNAVVNIRTTLQNATTAAPSGELQFTGCGVEVDLPRDEFAARDPGPGRGRA